MRPNLTGLNCISEKTLRISKFTSDKPSWEIHTDSLKSQKERKNPRPRALCRASTSQSEAAPRKWGGRFTEKMS